MPDIDIDAPGKTLMMMGNEAIARGALEAGIGFIAAYPGTPSTEITPTLASVAERRNLYAEWSINEMVGLMNAVAAACSGIRSMSPMKQNGTNVALDLISTQMPNGLRGGGGLVIVNVDDPGRRNSPNEQDTRTLAKMMDMPMLEPGDFQEAKEMSKWLFELSEELDCMVMLRTVAKISHTRGNVTLGELSINDRTAKFELVPKVPFVDPANRHADLHKKVERAKEIFEDSPFNTYTGPEKPELLVITCGASYLYTMEAIRTLGLQDRIAVLKLGTIWPLPEKLIEKHLKNTEQVLFIEEVDPFVERGVLELTASLGPTGPRPVFYGKRSGHIPSVGELNPDTAIQAVAQIMGVQYQARDPKYAEMVMAASKEEVIPRMGTLCAGCPHRASYWALNQVLKLDGNEGFATADNGCMSAGYGSGGFSVAKIGGAMGGGVGIADGLGKLKRFGFTQPVFGGVGDSTFYHAGIPALLSAVWNKSDFTLIIYDNSATAMTGFQPNPGTGKTVMGGPAQLVPLEDICRSFGIRVEICDPFELKETTEMVMNVMEDDGNGPRVIIMRHECELQRARREDQHYDMLVDPKVCLGDDCGCNRFCVSAFKCPGLRWNTETGKSEIDEVICCGCGLCTDICPQGAIHKEPLEVILNRENAAEGVQV
jgi:indolepyruvate ferredoxin oxidoreductase, alpha subunit